MKNTSRGTLFAKSMFMLAIAWVCLAGCGGGDDGDSTSHENGTEDGGSSGGGVKGGCTGTPTSCDFLSAPGCYVVSGCSMRSRTRWNGTFDNYCDGIPDACSSFVSASACKDQGGCTWK